MLSTKDKAWLAEFAGLKLLKDPSTNCEVWFVGGKVTLPYCGINDWSPDTDPAHGWLVLWTLIEKHTVEAVCMYKAFGDKGDDDIRDWLKAG